MDTTKKIVSDSKHQRFLKNQLATQENKINNLAKEDVFFVSSKKFLGFSRLIKSLQTESKYRRTRGIKRNVFVIGNINSGKSSFIQALHCLLYTSPSPRDLSTSRMPSSA